MVIHRGVEPHHCRIYEKAFASKSELTKHMKIQTGEKPHQYSYCDKAFDNKKHYKCILVIMRRGFPKGSLLNYLIVKEFGKPMIAFANWECL